MGSLAHFFEEKGIAKGKAEGVVQGIFQEKKKIARIMLNKGADFNFIREVTKLTPEDIKQIQEGETE